MIVPERKEEVNFTRTYRFLPRRGKFLLSWLKPRPRQLQVLGPGGASFTTHQLSPFCTLVATLQEMITWTHTHAVLQVWPLPWLREMQANSKRTRLTSHGILPEMCLNPSRWRLFCHAQYDLQGSRISLLRCPSVYRPYYFHPNFIHE